MTIQGFILIDVDIAALNNAGGDTSTALENSVVTKKIKKNGKDYPYVSGQAWRYWWREALKEKFNWEMSPITREKKIAFTEADPFKYADDDIFGYMRAAKKEVMDSDTGKVKSENITLTRVSPLKNSALMAVAYNPVVQNWSSMTRQDGDAVPYGKDEYCAVMKGMFSLDIDAAGTFSMQNRSGFMNINDAMKNQALSENAITVNDPYQRDISGKPVLLVRIEKSLREKRIKETVAALKYLSGGAKRTTNYADVSPKLIVLAAFKSGNHPFSHLAKEDLGKAIFSIDALNEVLQDYADQFDGPVFIGRRAGFMDELDESLKNLDNTKVTCGPINQIIDRFVDQIRVD
ncbi:MAG TPA: type I-B CRISPR-associated protein Cas7/Cst2/DevR [bacterium]|nr:type I-B CRISPR-associated protein Cas7/Cst2/DevR [bacterium]